LETGDIAADISKLRELTGWQPLYTLRDGIQQTYDYYRQHYQHYV